MKRLGVIAALAVAGVATWFALQAVLVPPYAARAATIGAPERPLVFVPGLLGSKLCRKDAAGSETVAWGTIDAMGQFPTLTVAPDDGLAPCGLIREIAYLGIFSQAFYGPFIDRLHAAGYRDGETLFVFDYDWRQSIFVNAQRLAAFVDANLPGNGKIDIVGHSMGGLIARTYAIEDGGAARIGRLVSAGSPWHGSVQVFPLLQSGWGLGTMVLGGIENFRRTVGSFPSTFELMPQYDGCCFAGFDAASADAWSRLNWTGLDGAQLPDLAGLAARQQKLQAIFAQPLPGIEEALAIGVDQRTPQHYALLPGSGETQLDVATSWDGDGTVMRDSSVIADRVVFPTSFATHDALLNEPSVQDFVLAALADGPAAAAKEVPVRPRTSILTALGTLVELVGVAVDTDRPVYATGSSAKAVVHVRPGTMDKVDAGGITLTVTLPGTQPMTVALVADPAASDPTNPFEQSFSAMIDTGGAAGPLVLTATIATPGADARVVTATVPVLAN